MSEARPLPPSALCRRCDPGSFAFATTADLADVPGIIGQERAEEAVRFAIGIRRYGYNLYALGTSAPPGPPPPTPPAAPPDPEPPG